MKNGILKLFLVVFLLVHIIFFFEICSIFIVLSELMWAGLKFDLMLILLAVCFVVAFTVFLIYFLKHRNKIDIVETVEFKSPDGLTPIEVGFLVDGKVDGEDVSAMLVYWASQKYIKIVKNPKNKNEQKLIKLVKSLPQDSKKFEKKLFMLIFKDKDEVLVSQIMSGVRDNEALAHIVKDIEKNVGNKHFNKSSLWFRQVIVCVFAFLFYFSVMYFRLEYYIDFIPIVESFAIISTSLFVIVADFYLKYYDYRHKNNSSRGRIVSFVFMIVLLAIIGILCVYFFYTDIEQVVFLLCAVGLLFIICLLISKINIYKNEGIKKLGEILGFKRFIEVAEKEKLEMLVEENPNLFFSIMPYAFVLGVSEKWIKDFDVIKVSENIIFDNQMLSNMMLYSMLYKNSSVNFVNSVKIAHSIKMLNVISKVGAISLGSNRKGGSSKGSSNFGGYRRR